MLRGSSLTKLLGPGPDGIAVFGDRDVVIFGNDDTPDNDFPIRIDRKCWRVTEPRNAVKKTRDAFLEAGASGLDQGPLRGHGAGDDEIVELWVRIPGAEDEEFRIPVLVPDFSMNFGCPGRYCFNRKVWKNVSARSSTNLRT